MAFSDSRNRREPIERATKFLYVLNLKTAKALGVAIPQSVLVRANQVIE